MRTTTILAAVLCGLMLTLTPATSQTGPDPDLPCFELYAIVPTANGAGGMEGRLYGYNVAPSGNLSILFGIQTGFSACPGSPSLPGPTVRNWMTTSFTQPTLADNSTQSTTYGAIYVPTACAITNTTDYSDCRNAGSARQSGILVFTNCPSSY